MTTLAERLRAHCATLRTKPTPLADLIPLLQQAADALDAAAAPVVWMRKGTLPQHGTMHNFRFDNPRHENWLPLCLGQSPRQVEQRCEAQA
jgi:hypothetical protein